MALGLSSTELANLEESTSKSILGHLGFFQASSSFSYLPKI